MWMPELPEFPAARPPQNSIIQTFTHIHFLYFYTLYYYNVIFIIVIFIALNLYVPLTQ